MERRYLSLWFPFLATDSLLRRGLYSREDPLALTAEDHGRSVVTASNQSARQEGITPGMTLAMARAICSNLNHQEDAPEETARLLEKTADWCDRFTPLVGLDGGDGLMLDVSGCAHLHGGEESFLAHVQDSLKGQGFEVRAAIAETPSAAAALARYGRGNPIVPSGKVRESLSDLPVAALGQTADVTESLLTVGLDRLARLYEIPRASLASRYGMDPALKLDRMLGYLPDPISPRPHKSPYQVRLAFPDPVGHAEDIRQAVLDLLEEICTRLEADRRGARQFCLRILKTGNQEQRILVGTMAPSCHAGHLMRLFEEKLAHVEPGFGIDCFLLSASRTDPLQAVQSPISHFSGTRRAASKDKSNPSNRDEAGILELADRLRNRLGPKSVYHLSTRDSHLPDRAQILKPGYGAVARQLKVAELPEDGWPGTAPRPIRLLCPPVSVQLLSLADPDQTGSPSVSCEGLEQGITAFRWLGETRRIRRYNGPERISPDWWQARPDWYGLRDYYRVEDDRGRRYWLYREQVKKGECRWFLHGIFQ